MTVTSEPTRPSAPGGDPAPIRIAVVIPVKDDREMLEQCLLALADQTRPADEVIVVDNDSDDGSGEVARRWGATVVFEGRPGIGAAAAAGYDAASTEIIARLDADSVPPPDWLRRVELDFVRHPTAVAVSGRGHFYDVGRVVRALADVLYMRLYFSLGRLMLGNRVVFGSNFAMRSSLWRQLSGRVHRDDAEVHDDIDLSYHIDPAQNVLFDRRLVVGISGRPFADAVAMRRRVWRAGHTATVHGLRESPLPRRIRRVLGRRSAAASARQGVSGSLGRDVR